MRSCLPCEVGNEAGIILMKLNHLTRMLPVVDYMKMQRIGDILGKKYGNLTRVIRIREKWVDIAGEVLAAHTEPVQLRGKTLHVLCDSPAWVQQIDILTTTLEPRVKKMAGVRVDKIAGTFSMAIKTKKQLQTKRMIRKPDIDPEDISKISDPVLRNAVEELVALQEDNNG